MSQKVRAKQSVVRLLESYILDVLDALPEEQESATKVIMKRAFGRFGNWRSRLRDEFGFSASVDAQLRAMWGEAQRLAKEKGAQVTPAEFARAVVEENFTDSIEMVSTEIEKSLER